MTRYTLTVGGPYSGCIFRAMVEKGDTLVIRGDDGAHLHCGTGEKVPTKLGPAWEAVHVGPHAEQLEATRLDVMEQTTGAAT